ncbi:hypothetical protein BJF90_39880 [Pseudonocardia sp. CNS-004]|nr:hypothetical protein BJF90_39880 [Pseudonocardia sp. CNS-004]
MLTVHPAIVHRIRLRDVVICGIVAERAGVGGDPSCGEGVERVVRELATVEPLVVRRPFAIEVGCGAAPVVAAQVVAVAVGPVAVVRAAIGGAGALVVEAGGREPLLRLVRVPGGPLVRAPELRDVVQRFPAACGRSPHPQSKGWSSPLPSNSRSTSDRSSEAGCRRDPPSSATACRAAP